VDASSEALHERHVVAEHHAHAPEEVTPVTEDASNDAPRKD
jgi:hypothetical protein